MELKLETGCHKLRLFALWILIFIASHVGFMIVHENIHAQICRQYGGVPTIDFVSGFPFAAYTYCTVSNSQTLMANAIVEAVGYHTQVLISVLCLLALLVIAK